MIKKIDHLVITTNDFSACTVFYTKLGFTVKDCSNRLEMFAGDFKINVHKKGAELNPHARNVCIGSADLCIEVENLQEFILNLQKQKVEIELGVVSRNGVNGTMQSVYIRDTDSNLLEFCCYKIA